MHDTQHQAFIIYDVYFTFYFSVSFLHSYDEIRGGERPVEDYIIRGQWTHKSTSGCDFVACPIKKTLHSLC